ncbi:Vacuolar protein sorting-associated protein 62 [Teratosphaeriaceae sp. CCFEE 6253]|nr:Vacuolar protein sorting-associated protein 62 [Teratosphaeriaceae sp. CCFEE 6253]
MGLAIVFFILEGVSIHMSPKKPPEKILENLEWVATGKSWVDRQFCEWFSLCGTYHAVYKSGWTWSMPADDIPPRLPDFAPFWESSGEDPDGWSKEEKALREIPDFVFEYAPYVHLFSGEKFWPSDLGEHLAHVSPHLNYTVIEGMEEDRNLTNLRELNVIEDGRNGRFVYLQSDDNVEEQPSWLTSNHNIPSAPEPGLEDHLDVPWPSDDEDDYLSDHGTEQNILDSHIHMHSPVPVDVTPSLNGRCGGNSGFTCKGSKFGKCCSIHGWCGKSDEFCETYCDPLHGECSDLLHPPPASPRPDLRKRSTDAPDKPAPQPRFGKSNAPAILVVVDKGNGTIDAFWFFFYSFNQGQKVFNIRFGNHVGDWEHTLVRFHHGQPEYVFFSEHDFGDAYAWHAVEKYLPNPDGSGTMLGTLSNDTIARVAKRPVIYSAYGSHAMYATPGLHPYILPWGLLHDQTDRGPLWDPTLNVKSFTYDPHSRAARASLLNPRAPTGWFDYAGHWGDKYYPLSDPRQYRFAGEYHYVNGPTGPKFKRLGREKVCQGRGECRIRHWLGHQKPRRLKPADGEGGEEGGLPGGNSTEDAG